MTKGGLVWLAADMYRTSLNESPIYEWGKNFVDFKTEFMRQWACGYVFSTLHGIDFFENVMRALGGLDVLGRDKGFYNERGEWSAEWPEKGELGENFRKFIKSFARV
jgi:hypothetical protein